MIEIIPNWHPVFVHFTVAMLVTAAAIHLLSHFLPKGDLANQLTIVARWNLWFGVGFTLLTVAAGWYAYNTVVHDAPSHLAMTEHRNWAMVTFALLLGIAAWEYYLSRRGKGKGWLFTGLLVIAAGLLLNTAWHGGELVYRYGLGVMSLPKQERNNDDGHEHGAMQGGTPMSGEPTSSEQDHAVEPMPKIPATNGTALSPNKAAHDHAPGIADHAN